MQIKFGNYAEVERKRMSRKDKKPLAAHLLAIFRKIKNHKKMGCQKEFVSIIFCRAYLESDYRTGRIAVRRIFARPLVQLGEGYFLKQKEHRLSPYLSRALQRPNYTMVKPAPYGILLNVYLCCSFQFCIADSTEELSR